MNQRLYYLSAILFILAITFLTYYPALSNGFILNWDDGIYVIQNEHIQSLSLDNLWWMFTAFYAANWHPLTWLSHAIDYAIYGDVAWGHHLTSVIFHALNSLWVFLLSLVLIYIVEKSSFETFKFNAIFNPKRVVVALLTAILFAIHPQHVESVAWIAERKDVLFFFFFIPSLLSYSIYTQVQKKSWHIASLVLFALSLLSKPMAITLPILLILFDVYPLKQIDLNKIDYRKWIINKIPFLIIALAAGVFTLLAQSKAGGVVSVEAIELKIRLLNAAHSLLVYFEKWLLPLHLSPFYQLHIERFQSIQNNLVNLVTILATTVIVIYFWFKSQKAWLIGWLFYVITLLPVLGLIQVGSQGMADRYAYLPTLPFYLLLSIGLVVFYQKYSKLFSVLLIITISILFINLTHTQISIWRNPLSFWDYVVRSDPDSYLAQRSLGTVHLKLGHYELASKHLEFSLGLSNGIYSAAHYDLGKAYFGLGRFDEALREYHIALESDLAPNVKANIHYDIALLYLSRGEKQQAQTALEQTLKIIPNHLEALKLRKQ